MEAVIRAHHAHCVRFFDCGTESRQIDFPQGAFADVRVVACTVCFLVVKGIMLDTGRNIILQKELQFLLSDKDLRSYIQSYGRQAENGGC